MLRFHRLALLACLALSILTTPAFAQRGTIPVNIESTPPGATVRVDDPAAAPLGVTPLRNARVPRGAHTLLFHLDGHADATLPVNVRRRRETFRATLAAQSVIDVRAGGPNAEGASIKIDGVPMGEIPLRQIVEPGRHMIQVSREGFVTFTQWVEVAGAQVMTLPVLLQAERPRTGSLLVAADVSGAEVFIDGEARGTTPTLIEGLSAGTHAVEVRSEGLETQSQSIVIEVDRRATISATLRPAPPPGGSLVVVANVPNATVSLDGELRGQTPLTLTDVPAGEHILEITAPGHQPADRTVTVTAGARRAVQVELEAEARPPGELIVRADVEGAVVFVDGEERGPAPAVVRNLGEGMHAIVVRAEGRREYRTTCRVAPGEDCTIDANLASRPVTVRWTANVQGAELFVDGDRLGLLPYEGEIPSGSHTIEVRAPGHRTHTETMRLVSSAETQDFAFTLRGDGPTEQELAVAAEEARLHHRSTVSHSGAVLPDDQVVMDMSLGYPHALELRLGIGIFKYLDAGMAVRTFLRMTEVEGRARNGFRPIDRFSVAAQVRLGGGVGLRKANTYFFSFEGLSSLHFAERAVATATFALDYSNDAYPYAENDSELSLANDDRQSLWRFRVGFNMDVVVAEHWNVFTEFNAIVVQSDPGRRMFGDVYGGGRDDRGLYARLGLTYKF